MASTDEGGGLARRLTSRRRRGTEVLMRVSASLLTMFPLVGCGALLLGCGALLLGCGTGPTHAVKLRATSDLYCPNNKIDVDSDGGECGYVAVGCGKKATYIVEPREEGASGCCPAPGCRAHRQGAVTAE